MIVVILVGKNFTHIVCVFVYKRINIRNILVYFMCVWYLNEWSDNIKSYVHVGLRVRRVRLRKNEIFWMKRCYQ